MGEGKRTAPGPSAAVAVTSTSAASANVGQVANLRGGWPINIRPQLTKLPHNAIAIYFSSTVITRSTGGFSNTCLPPPGQVTVSLSILPAAPNPKCTRGSSDDR